MGELLDHVPIAGEHDPDVAPGTQSAGEGGGNSGEPADPDEIVHFRGDEENLQDALDTRSHWWNARMGPISFR